MEFRRVLFRSQDSRPGFRSDAPPGARSAAAATGRGGRVAAMAGKRTRFRQIFLTHLRQVKGRLAIAAVGTLGATATELLKPWPLKIILDHVIYDNPLSRALRLLPHAVADDKVRLLVAASVGILLIALASGLFSYAQIFITSSIGYRMVYALRRELFAHLQTLSLSFHNQSRSGDLLTKIAGDTNTLKDIFADSILKFTTYVLTVAGMFAVMFALNWHIGLIALATMPFLSYSLFHLYRKTKASVKTQRRQEGKVASRMSEVLSAIPLVRSEEHTSELQSRLHLVCRLLLEKKKHTHPASR